MGTYRFVVSLPGEAFGSATPEVFETKGFNMLTAELQLVCRQHRARRPFPTPLADIRHGVAVFEAILRSAASGKAEAVSQDQPAGGFLSG